MLTVCGIDCSGCSLFGKECSGCRELCGRVYWVQYIGAEVCPLVQCCEDKGVSDCGKCSELPCGKWYDLKDPNISEDDHLTSIHERVAVLKKNM